MLMEVSLQQAVTMGLDVSVHAKKAGLGVYKRLGFELVDQVVIDESKYGGPDEYSAYFLMKRVKWQESVEQRRARPIARLVEHRARATTVV